MPPQIGTSPAEEGDCAGGKQAFALGLMRRLLCGGGGCPTVASRTPVVQLLFGLRRNCSYLSRRECQVQEASPELSPEERRVLERKLKKERKKEEKKRLREAGIAAAQTAKVQILPAKPSAATLALEYLQGWAQKQKSWRFQKTRQTWLLTHMYDEDKVPDEHFPTLLDYLEGLRGSARELTVQKAEALMQKLDEAEPEVGGGSPGKVQRLRQVLQLLS